MKNIKTFCLLILLLFNGLNIVFAQITQPTPYQKKQLELSKKWFQILTGYEMSMSDEVFYEQLTAGKEANDFVLGLAILNYAMYNSKSQCEKTFTKMNNEFKQAEKLKNATDFRLEKEAKARKEQAEKERKLRAEQEAYAKTDIGSIQKNIKSEFEKWNPKGEFEKEIDYTERLKNQSRTAFDSICLEKIKTKINGLNSYYWTKELSTYNSEKEFFPVLFKTNGVEWQSKINIPISQAENFKNNWSNLKMKIDDYDWCFVENSLCPTLIVLENKSENSIYKFPLNLQNQSEILYYFNDLEIDNFYLKDYIFKFSNAKIIAEQIEKEKQRKDSLELVTLNQQLNSIFNDYNNQLLQNPYNVSKKVMSDFKQIDFNLEKGYYDKSISETRQKKFNEYKSEIERKFTNLNNNFERELKSSNPEEYCKIYFTLNPDKMKEADKMYLECRCNYPKREDFDLKFIAGNLYNCNCRENEYRKNGKLFESKNEFDSFYDKGDDIYFAEYEKRTVLNYLNINNQYLESMDFQKEKKESAGSIIGRGLLEIATNSNISAKDYTTENEIRKNILSIITNCQNKIYYNQVIDIVIETNKKLNKEWGKNGQNFENKAEFYNAYLSEDYKKILKEKKK
jgi:hypothetical protein